MSIIVIIITTVVMVIFGGYRYFQSDSSMKADLAELASVIVERQSIVLRTPLWDLNEQLVDQSIRAEMPVKHVAGVVVTEGDAGKIFSAIQRDVDWKVVPTKDAIKGDYITAEKEIIKDDKKLGTVRVYLTKKFFNRELTSLLYGILIEVFLIVALLAGALMVLMKRLLVKPLTESIRGLDEGAGQVTSVSTSMADTSQQLAQGAAEQAASLEETSSSMEEMSSMIKRNAENADMADKKMIEVAGIVENANGFMEDLIAAMDKINKASDETAKIIQTIDGIAFQTNLLALNAAVEAARAGEAGAGFAVVADEVRNLAMRAAEAARSTSTLIEENLKDIKNGADLVAKTDGAFREVRESASKVGALVGEISQASREQSEGISQINNAMGEMDKVTQANAANAEESAAASEELSAQAETVAGHVRNLSAVIGGSAARIKKTGRSPKKKNKGKQLLTHNAGAAPKPAKAGPPPQKAKQPADVIPLSDDEFEDF